MLYDPLHEDLVDHFCCEIEVLMNTGSTFGEAYKLVMSRFERRGIAQLNEETVDILNPITMIRNYLITTLRVFRKNLLTNAIRILGLAVGIAVFMLSSLYWNYEHSYDQFQDDADSIYRIGRVTELGQVMTTTFPLVPALRTEFPEYQFTQFFKDRSRSLFRKDQVSNYEDGLIWADENFLQFFQFDNFIGEADTALTAPLSVVVTEDFARRYFTEPARLGDTIELSWNGAFHTLRITGIIPKWPAATHIQFDVIISMRSTEQLFPGSITNNWNMNYCFSYVKLPTTTTPDQFEERFPQFVQSHIPDQQSNFQEYLGFLQPLTKIHTQPEVMGGYTDTIDVAYLRLVLGIGFVILLITSLNFITLTVAQFHERSREVGIRKAIGAYQMQIVNLFLFETGFLVLLSFGVGMVVMVELIEIGNRLFDMQLNLADLWDTRLAFATPLFLIFLTLATGLYPAIIISSSDILHTLQLKKNSGVSFRKLLLGAQFFVAASLASFCWIVYGQLDFLQSTALGYSKEQILTLPQARQIRDNPDVFKSRALAYPGIRDVSVSFYKPGDDITTTIPVQVNGNEAKYLSVNSVDEDFFDTYEIEFTSGVNFDPSIHNLDTVFIVNESAVRFLQLDDPFSASLFTRFTTGQPSLPVEERSGRIIGVIKDVHFESLHQQIKPMIFLVKPYWYFFINVKIDASNAVDSIEHLRRSWTELHPDRPFEYQFLDEDFARLYEDEQLLGRSVIVLTVLAVLTACSGLFGYTRFLARQMLKEISIRKVLGANLLQISLMVSRSCVMSVILASVISWPIVYYSSQRWLESFSYRPEHSFIPYFIAFLLLVSVSVLTMSREILRVGQANPSDALRYT